MKNIKIVLFIILVLGCKNEGVLKKDINVLFIGNSLTYFYDMPQTLQKMLNETQSNIRVEQSTFPGMPLSGHLTYMVIDSTENGISTREKEAGEITKTEKKISERNWDIIILQTGTTSVLIPENRKLKVQKAIAEIKKLITNESCEFIIFNTWPSKGEYPKEYCYPSSLIDDSLENKKYCSPLILNLKQENDLINKSYEELATENSLRRSNNGTKFFETRNKYPEIELYEDKSHPNKYGAYLNACIFYQMITGKKAKELNFIGDIDPKFAKQLKLIAE